MARAGLAAMISHQPAVRVIAEAGRGREAIDEFLSAHPDKAVMDLRMPVLDGFEAKTAVFQNDPAARVVFVTAFGTEIEKAQQLKPDVIVLDLAMPVMNGLEAARELTRVLPCVPLLMVTSYETAHLRQEALSAGVRTVMSKSDSIEALVNSIQVLLEPVS